VKRVLEPDERRLWRRYERGLRVMQVGDATRPLASGEYFSARQVRVLLEQLRDEYGDAFRTAITTKSVEPRLAQLMAAAGVPDPETLHYGEEKSRNDFAQEPIGLVNGCLDPGDDYVLDLLAELDCEASPETTVDDAGEEHRAHGRGFVGPDADIAQAILASVRENHTAQAAGRYAREPEDPAATATVFVRTDAMPPGFADVQVPDVEWVFTDDQQAIVETLRAAPGSRSARDLAADAGVSKEYARQTLTRLAKHGLVQALEGAGAHGATLYSDTGLPTTGVVDISTTDTANDHVWDPYTWALAIREPVVGLSTPSPAVSEPAPTPWQFDLGGGHADTG
jgi:hypothetical protein